MPPGPHLLDDVGVGLGDLALHPERVGEVQLVHVRVAQEVLRQGGGVTETLQREGRKRRKRRKNALSTFLMFTVAADDLKNEAPEVTQIIY